MKLEQEAKRLWARWGNEWLLFTRCAECGEQRLCRGRRRAYLLCLDCWDQVDP